METELERTLADLCYFHPFAHHEDSSTAKDAFADDVDNFAAFAVANECYANVVVDSNFAYFVDFDAVGRDWPSVDLHGPPEVLFYFFVVAELVGALLEWQF